MHIASVYTERFSRSPIEMPIVTSHKKSVFYRYVIRSDRMRNIQERAKKKGVICQPPVFEPIHSSLASVKCPNSDRAFEEALSVPLYPSLTDEEIEYLIQTLGPILGSENGTRL
jgi:dTDP-4-amino-4,6-dideoxygalactose transaminase